MSTNKVHQLPKGFLKDLGEELKQKTQITSEDLAKIMRDASRDSAKLNDLIRQASIAAVGKIPSVGMAISPIISYLWPEQAGVDSKLNALEARITAKIGQAVGEQHTRDIQSKIKDLKHAMEKLEDSLNTGTFYDGSVKDIHGVLRNQAKDVNDKFISLMHFTQQEHNEIVDLPIYTKVAAAHILFLKYLKTHGTDPKLFRYDKSSTLNAEFKTDNIESIIATYAKHIEDTFKKGDNKLATILKTRAEKIAKKRNLIVPGIPTNIGTESQIHTLENEIKGIDDLKVEEKRALYRDLTVNEGSFEAISGKKLTYTNFGWIIDGGKWYYLSPYKDFINYDGKTFDKGELVTGWLKPYEEKNYYYLSPADGTKNDDGKVFNKGEMTTGWMQVGKKSTWDGKHGAWYYLDNKEGNKDFKGTTGRMLHDETARVKNKQGDFKKHYFNENGTWGDN
ncbi:insecticidal delta-endotoxin Cry8Ea1 family protein [Bacillus cereus]|uniref:insecticidal delta-endotoxin Cry8Ea1 family protein n=1 Tax=Bacillus cereus TaxID=1396 RepID=UPI003D651B69